MVVVAAIMLIIGVVGFLLLSGDPVSEENNQCIGGGHATYGIAMLGVGVAVLLLAIASLVQGLRRRRRPWPLGVLGVILVAVGVVLFIFIPDTGAINVGQC